MYYMFLFFLNYISYNLEVFQKKTPNREFIKKLWIINVSLNQQKNVKDSQCRLVVVFRLVLY